MRKRFRPSFRNACSEVKRRRPRTVGMLLAIVCVIALWPADLRANTCVARKPTRVFGTLRGVVFDPSGARIPNAILRLHSETGSDEAEIRADSNGEFQFRFSSLPKGIYRVTTPSTGWQSGLGEVEVTGSRLTICKRTLLVEYGLVACEGGISRGRQPRP
jgi:hypothetical protein